MPLISKLPPGREHVDAFESSSLHVQHQLEQVREEQDSNRGYEDFGEYNDDDEAVLDSDMEGSILHRPRPKKVVKAPVLPQRSEKRASKILENVMQELKNLDEDAAKEQAERMSVVPESDPHEQYLSSEEDASLSDDYEGSLVDFEESDEEETRGRQSSRASRRKSQEDTARVVSFIVVGKPMIVNIFSTSPTASLPSSRHSMNLDALTSFKTKPIISPSKPTTRRPAPLTLYPSSRRMSISSTTSYIPLSANSLAAPPMQHQNASMNNLSMGSSHDSSTSTAHPARKSSRLGLSNLTSLVINHTSNNRKSSFNSYSNPTPITASSTHSFLNSDPFAHTNQEATHYLPPSPTETPTTPKTPNSLAMWKKGLSRTLSKARKPSMNKLSQTYHSHAASSSTLSLSSTTTTNTQTTHPRSSTSYGHSSSSTLSTFVSNQASDSNSTSSTTLSRITSNPEPPTPKQFETTGAEPTMSRQMEVATRPSMKRSETMPMLLSPRESAPAGVSVTYDDIMRAAITSPPVPEEPVKTVKDWRKDRRSFGIMGRRKSVKK